MYLRALETKELDDERTAKLPYQVVKLRLDAFDAAGAVAFAPRLELRRGAWPGGAASTRMRGRRVSRLG